MNEIPRPAARRKASDFDQRILEIFDGCVHGRISRRDFIVRAGKYASAGVTGAMILEQLQPNYAFARLVAADDPAIETMTANTRAPRGTGRSPASWRSPPAPQGPCPWCSSSTRTVA